MYLPIVLDNLHIFELTSVALLRPCFRDMAFAFQDHDV